MVSYRSVQQRCCPVFSVPWGRYSREITFSLSDANILSFWGTEWTVISFRHKVATVMSLFSKVVKASSAENLQTDHSVPSLCLSGNRMRCSVKSCVLFGRGLLEWTQRGPRGWWGKKSQQGDAYTQMKIPMSVEHWDCSKRAESIGFTIPSLDGFIYTSVYTGGNVTRLSLSLQGTFI